MRRFEREPEPVRSHRTTARLLPFAVLFGLVAGTASAAPGVEPDPSGKAWRQIPAPKVRARPRLGPNIIFPVVGPAKLFNDYGAPRGNGRHEGNDIVAPKRALVVAVEPGKVRLWISSWRAGCMLYLYGKSGTTYLYVHLNNDLTEGNDNRGKCVPGVAFARGLKSGESVVTGEPLGYVGDSGDANGVVAHLHFEIHPGGGGSVNPYPRLRQAKRLLFAAPPQSIVSLALKGTFVSVLPEKVRVKVSSLRVSTGLRIPSVGRVLRMRLPETAFVEWVGGIPFALTRLTTMKVGQPLTAWTVEDFVSFAAQLGKPDVLEVARIQFAQ